MEKYYFMVIIALCTIGYVNTSLLNSKTEQLRDNEFSEIKNGQCGGTIELDSGTLIYPGEGLINPGELCIWTIHLRTMDGFRMNFTNLDLAGGSSSCNNSSVSIYGLSNLIPSDSPERYRFCNENNNGGYHFLTGNIATVVFYTSSSFPVNSSDTGFSLHWEGSRFQQVPTLHSSSYTSSPSGVVFYPVEGEYPPNAGMTWLVNGAGTNNASSLIVDILSISFENCSLSDRCLCEALIIYDISQTGELHEVDRFCGERNRSLLANVSSHFIVAFYSDNDDVPWQGYGFRMDWLQQPEIPTIKTCGGIIEGNEGIIEYSLNETYTNYERCIWTLRLSPATTQIELTKVVSGFEVGLDYLTAFSFAPRQGLIQTQLIGKGTNSEEQVVMNGSVVILQFSTDATVTGRGFRLHFRAVGEPERQIRAHQDENVSTYPGSIEYPVGNANYRNYELSTFVISKNYKTNLGNLRLTMDSYSIENSSGCVYDALLVYSVQKDTAQQLARYCGESNEPIELSSDSAFIIVLFSDSSNVYGGFRTSWV